MRLSPWVLRTIGAGMTILFIVWAYYQRNDVDPLVWVTIYAIAALFSLLFMVNKLASSLALGFGIVCLAGAIYLFSKVEFGPALITIEAWREAVGLLIISTWMGIMLLFQRQAKPVTSQAIHHFKNKN